MTAPISLPEFDRSFSWAMCRNAMCENFGLHYTGAPPIETDPVAHDARYRLELKDRIRCKQCGQSFEIMNNQAVSPIARYFLSLSLPFADCPDEQCKNYGYNGTRMLFGAAH